MHRVRVRARGSLSPNRRWVNGAGSSCTPPRVCRRWKRVRPPGGVKEDADHLSELQCVLRSEFVEVFGTTQVS